MSHLTGTMFHLGLLTISNTSMEAILLSFFLINTLVTVSFYLIWEPILDKVNIWKQRFFALFFFFFFLPFFLFFWPEGTGFQSKGSYLFGHFSMRIKMVGGDSAGVVTAFYVHSYSHFYHFIFLFF